MNKKTDQMSLLDAIGFSAPEKTEITKKTSPKKVRAVSEDPAPEPSGRLAANTSERGRQNASVSATKNGSSQIKTIAAEKDRPAGNSGSDPAASLPLDRFLCFALYSANHAMHGVYKGLLKEIGLTYPQFLAMTVLWETNNVPVGTITSKLQLDTNTLTPLLKRLEAMGLLTRTRNSRDERQVILKLTRKGRALQRKTEHFSTCVLSSSGISMNEVMDLQSRIMKLRDNLRTAE